MELTYDGWESVFKKLRKHDFKSVSLVCKQFYSISNKLVFNLKITYSEDDHHLLLPQILKRFTLLKSIRFDHRDHRIDTDSSVIKIAHSGLKHFEKLDLSSHVPFPVQGIKELGFANMRSLRVLHCSGMMHLNDSDLFVIASSLPWLQELDISSCPTKFTDTGVAQLAANLPGLLRINMLGNRYISDQSLYYLLSSCHRIAEIKCWCRNITVKAIIDVICGYSNLLSLRIGWIGYDRSDLSRCCLAFDYNTTEAAHVIASFERANLPLHEITF